MIACTHGYAMPLLPQERAMRRSTTVRRSVVRCDERGGPGRSGKSARPTGGDSAMGWAASGARCRRPVQRVTKVAASDIRRHFVDVVKRLTSTAGDAVADCSSKNKELRRRRAVGECECHKSMSLLRGGPCWNPRTGVDVCSLLGRNVPKMFLRVCGVRGAGAREATSYRRRRSTENSFSARRRSAIRGRR
jgi:hypothetical protein